MPGHRVDADVRLRVIECRRLGETDHTEFRGAVRGLTCNPFDAGTRGGVHDDAGPLLQHHGDLVLHAQKYTAQIDVDDSVPLLLSDIGRVPDGLFDGGVIERKVQSSEGVGRLVERGFHLLSARHIAAEGERLRARIFDHASRFQVAFLRDVGDHNVGALARECQSRSAADAGSPPVTKATLPTKLRLSGGIICSNPSRLSSTNPLI
jgi:hypothetical protein